MRDFKKFAKRRYRVLFNKLVVFRKKEKSELLHDIRVEIKKIKTLLLATEYCLHGFNAHRNFVPVRVIFRRAGEIRDKQVSHALLMKFKMKDKPSMEKRTNQLIADFARDVPAFKSIVREEWQAVKNDFAKVKRKLLKKYISELGPQLKEQLFPTVDLTAIHKIRKLIKQLIYLSEIIPSRSKKQNRFFAKLSESIGALHDRQTLMKNLKPRPNKVNTLLIQKISCECDSLAKKIEKQSAAYYGR